MKMATTGIPFFATLLLMLFSVAGLVSSIPQIKDLNVTCPGGPERVLKMSRVGDDVVLPCGETEDSKEALLNKTVVIWSYSSSSSGSGSGEAGDSSGEPGGGTITIPIVPSETSPAGHTFQRPERYERIIVNYANASLRLLNVTLTDRKEFYCKIYRGAICFYVVLVQLVVVDRPGPPTNVSVEAEAENRIRIRWLPGPDNYSPITKYEIKVSRDRRTSTGDSPTQSVTVAAPQTDALMHHLQPYAVYLCRIKAFNDIGPSDWTWPVSQRTLEGEPEVSPVFVSTNKTNTSISVVVYVDDRGKARMRGQFAGMDARLELGEDIVDERSSIASDPQAVKSQQQFNFGKLKPYTTYKVLARVRNGRQPGKWNQMEVRTDQGLPGLPRVFATTVVRPNSFIVRWEAPVTTNGVVSSYEVTVIEKDSEQLQVLRSYEPSKMWMTITNLRPYTEYLVYVAAATDAGTGPKDGPQKVLTDIGPPDAPKLITVQINTSAVGVALDWQPPVKLLKPELTTYMLCWGKEQDHTTSCLHSQSKLPKMAAFIYDVTEEPPLTEQKKPIRPMYRVEPTYRAIIPWVHLTKVWESMQSIGNSKNKLYFSVYGRTKGLYCPSSKAKNPRMKITGRRLLRVQDKNVLIGRDVEEVETETSTDRMIDQNLVHRSMFKPPCFYMGEVSNFIQLVITDKDHERLISGDADSAGRNDAGDSSVIVLVTVLVLILVLVGATVTFFVMCRRCGAHRGYDLAISNGLERVNSVPRMLTCGETGDLEPAPMPTITPYAECGVAPIEAHDFPEHVAQLHANSEAGFSAEFDEIDKKQPINMWPDQVAKLPENAQKNRYTNIFPYDHTRVRVQNVCYRNQNGWVKKSDYINANYIDGYDRKNAYIAAQGPMPSTFEDFWQMIWDQRTNTIVMISNLIERGRLKCDQYWPSAFGQEGSQQYGRILVTLNRQVELAYYIVREMTVRNLKSKKCASRFRLLYHYQYTDWPDFAVPESPLPVLVFIRKTVSHMNKQSGPILVHCSAGVGRTGTYLSIESQIRQYEREKKFNVRGFLEHIRQQRMKLVQTEEQYAFIHDALLEHYLCPYHEIPRNELAAYVKCLKEVEPCSCVRLEREYQLCVSYRPHDWELICSMKAVNENKSRSDIYPVFTRQVALPAEPGVDGSNYINASYLQGFWRREEFIVTQHPFEHTVTDFWKMVWDQNSSQIILLTTNAPNMEYPCFWPAHPDDTKEAGYLRVGFLQRREYQHSMHLKFLVSSTREDYSLVSNMWVYKQWPNGMDGVLDLFHFIRQVQVEREKTGPFIVIDELGGSRAGIFCALNTLMDQLDSENCVDVYFVFKMYHRQRPGVFQCQADLEFIYDAIERYSREPPPPPPNHSSNSSHHSSPGNNTAGDPNGTQLLANDSLGRAGRLTPNGVSLLASADPAVSFYSNGGGTLPRLVVTQAPDSRQNDNRASEPCSETGNATEPSLA